MNFLNALMQIGTSPILSRLSFILLPSNIDILPFQFLQKDEIQISLIVIIALQTLFEHKIFKKMQGAKDRFSGLSEDEKLKILGALNLGSLIGVGILYWSMESKRHELKKIHKSKVETPASILEKLDTSDFRKKWKRDEPFLVKECLIEGVVKTPNPIRSKVNGTTPLILSYYLSNDLYCNDIFLRRSTLKWLRSYETTPKIEVANPFLLVDGNSRVVVHNILKADSDAAQVLISENEIHEKLSPAMTIFKWLSRAAGLCMSITSLFFPWKHRGLKIGYVESEFGIHLESSIVAYGEVIYNMHDKSLRINSPLFLAIDKKSLISHLRWALFQKRVYLGLGLLAFGASGYYLVKAVLRKLFPQNKAITQRPADSKRQ